MFFSNNKFFVRRLCGDVVLFVFFLVVIFDIVKNERIIWLIKNLLYKEGVLVFLFFFMYIDNNGDNFYISL